MMEMISQLFRWIKESKGKIALLIFSTVAFIFVLFPFNDLTDLISSQVSKSTQNQVFVQFDDLNVSLIPQPTLELGGVRIETATIPSIQTQILKVTPSLSGLLQQKPFGHVLAEGILKGTIEVDVSKGKRTEGGVERQQINLRAEKLNLKDLKELAQLPVLLKGQLNLNTTLLADFSFQEQPEMDIQLTIQQLEIPPANLNTPLGPLTLPDLRLSSVEMKGRLSAGTLIIEQGNLGKSQDELSGSLKGRIKLAMQPATGFRPQMGGYDLDLDLKMKKSFQDKAALFLSFIDTYKAATPEGAHYRFKVSGSGTQAPPQFSAVR